MKRIMLLLVMLTAGLSAWAESRVASRQLTTDDGLPSNTVRNIVQDQDGFIWLGTDNGLCRYDGTGIRVFTIDGRGTDQYVSALARADSLLYVGTAQGAYRFSPRTGQFHLLPAHGLNSVVRRIETGKNGTVSLLTAGQGVYEYAPATGQCHLRKYKDSDEEHAEVLTTRDGHRYTGTWQQGLLDADGRVVVPPRSCTHIHTLFELDTRTLLIGCDEGLVAYDRQTGTTELWGTPKFVYAITRDHEGGLWVGTFYAGVSYLSPVGQRFEGVKGHVISGFCEDAQGRLWTASDDNGLRCLSGSYPAESTLSQQNVHALALFPSPSASPTATAPTADGLWVGTYSGGVYAMQQPGGRLRHYTTADGLYDNSSYAIHRDAHGRLWVATMTGLCRYDATRDSLMPVRRLDGVAISMADESNGRLWVATQGAGLYRYDGQQWQHYRHAADTTTLPSDQVNCVVVARDGRVWIATEGGLCRYEPRSNTFRRIGAIGVVSVSSIVEAGANLWLATGKGVVRYTPGTGATCRFTREDGLVGLQFQPNACYRDSRGYIYFGTDNGYNRLLPASIRTNETHPRVWLTQADVTGKHPQLVNQLSTLNSQRTTLSLPHAASVSFSFASLSYCSPRKNQYAYRLDGYDSDWNYAGNTHRATYASLPAGTYTFRVRGTNNDGIWSAHEATLLLVVQPPVWWSWWARVAYAVLLLAVIATAVAWRRRANNRRQGATDGEQSGTPLPANLERERTGDTGAQTTATWEESGKEPAATDPFMERLNQLLEQHYADANLSVSFLAEQLAVSRSGLFAKTKALADMTPNEMIQLVRLRHAAALLAGGQHQVSEVCYMVGFSSPSYFAKCFQKQYGVRPGDMNKK